MVLYCMNCMMMMTMRNIFQITGSDWKDFIAKSLPILGKPCDLCLLAGGTWSVAVREVREGEPGVRANHPS